MKWSRPCAPPQRPSPSAAALTSVSNWTGTPRAWRTGPTMSVCAHPGFGVEGMKPWGGGGDEAVGGRRGVEVHGTERGHAGRGQGPERRALGTEELQRLAQRRLRRGRRDARLGADVVGPRAHDAVELRPARFESGVERRHRLRARPAAAPTDE